MYFVQLRIAPQNPKTPRYFKIIKSELDLLPGQLSGVLLLNAQSGQVLQLLLFDGLDLIALFVYLLSHFPAFLQEVQPLLLRHLVVLHNLGPQLVRVSLECRLLLLRNAALLLLDFSLLLDDAHELITLLLGLLSESHLLLSKLLLARLFHVSEDLLAPLLFFPLLLSRKPFTFFEGALGSELVNGALPVLSFFLHFSELLGFAFLILLNATLFSGFLFFAHRLVLVVFHYFLLKILLLHNLL